jgi:hypothetical protein
LNINIPNKKLDWLIRFLEAETEIGDIPSNFSKEEKQEILYNITEAKELLKLLKSQRKLT